MFKYVSRLNSYLFNNHNQDNLLTLRPNVWNYTGYLVESFARVVIATQINFYLKRNTYIEKKSVQKHNFSYTMDTFY